MDNIIVISGASRGIGFAIAELFAAQGWTIFTAARTEGDIKKMQEVWRKDFPESRLVTHMADLSTLKGCESFTSSIKTHTQSIQVLVNNVGQFAPGTLLGGDIDQLAHFMDTNVLSAHYLTRGLHALLSTSPQAQLFTIGSIAADEWPAHMATYALSKAFLHTWHRNIANELSEDNVRSTLIIPGATYTSSWKGIDVDPDDLLTPQQVAQLVWEHWNEKKAQGEVRIVK